MLDLFRSSYYCNIGYKKNLNNYIDLTHSVRRQYLDVKAVTALKEFLILIMAICCIAYNIGIQMKRK